MAKATLQRKSTKPGKPHKDYPLTPHPNGQWCKKVRGKVYFFGVWANPQAALESWLYQKDDLLAGRTPRNPDSELATTGDIVNLFLDRCQERVDAGELTAVSLNDYRFVGKQIVEILGRRSAVEGLRPTDFARFRAQIADKYSPSRLSKTVAVTRMILKWAHDSELIEKMPRLGPDFGVVSKRVHRLRKAQQGEKFLEREQAHKLLNQADSQWKAIILLCLNAALGNTDIGRLKISDIRGEWLDQPRGKTGIQRHIPLWPETREALKLLAAGRRSPKPEAADLLFLSAHGSGLVRIRSSGTRTDLTVEGFRRLAKRAGIWKPRMGLYWLRHTAATVADGAADPVAVSHLLGHADNSMTGHYRERIDDERLRKVTEHIRGWLLGREQAHASKK